MNKDCDEYLDICVEIHRLVLALADCHHARKIQTAREIGELPTGAIDPIEKIKTLARDVSEAYLSALTYDTSMVYPCGENSPLARVVQSYGL